MALPAEVTVSGWEMVGQDYDAPSLRLPDRLVCLFVYLFVRLVVDHPSNNAMVMMHH